MSNRSLLRTAATGVSALLLTLLAACATNEPTLTSPDAVASGSGNDAPTFLSASSGVATSTPVSFWAKQGDDRTGEIFAVGGNSGGNGDRLVRLRVRKDAQIVLPNGQKLAKGDSVLITMQIIDAVTLSTQFEPSGLRFQGKQAAQLTMWYGHTNAGGSTSLENQLAIYKQESSTDPWNKLSSTVLSATDEVQSYIGGFTNYVIAY